MSRGGAIVGVACLLLSAGCGNSSALPPATTSERPPLDDPPDPGPVPSDDGISDEALATIVESTVRITGEACRALREGSGFAVEPDLIATNAHVLLGIDEPLVELADGRELIGLVVGFDPVADLALLRVDGAELDPFVLGTAPDGSVGTLVGWEAKGTPEPTPFRIDRPVTVRINIVGGTERIERRSWLVAANIESGDSGAALIDDDGVVVGVAYATTKRDVGVAYATRADQLERLLAETDTATPVQVPDC